MQISNTTRLKLDMTTKRGPIELTFTFSLEIQVFDSAVGCQQSNMMPICIGDKQTPGTEKQSAHDVTIHALPEFVAPVSLLHCERV